MKKITQILALGILGLAVLWLGGMSLVNTRTTRVQVRVSGAVDEVRIFRSGDTTNPVDVIETGGTDTARIIRLASAESFSPFHQTAPASYTFTIRQGDQVYQGRKFCCESGLFPHRLTLTISSLSEWELTDQ